MRDPTPRTNVISMRRNGYTDFRIAELASKATAKPVAKSTIWRVRKGISLPRRHLALALLRLARRYGDGNG